MVNVIPLIGGSIGTCIYLLEEDGNIVLFDFVPQVEDLIRKNGYIPDKVILTHIHFDHIEMLSNFQKKYPFELLLSGEALEGINDPSRTLLEFVPELIRGPVLPVDLKNSKIIRDNDFILWKGHSIEAVSSAGHSPDSMMYIFRENKCVFTGDTIFYGSVGRTDFPGSSQEQLLASIKKLFTKIDDDFTLYPGHGPKTTAGFEKLNNPYIEI